MSLKFAIISPLRHGKLTHQLMDAFTSKAIPVQQMIPGELGLQYFNSRSESFLYQKSVLEIPDIALVRGVGTLIPALIFYRLDWLWTLEREGVNLVNSRACLEIATNKLLTTQVLCQHHIPNPETIMCEEPELALRAFDTLGGDVVLKPLYGARGRGIVRLMDHRHAETVFRVLHEIPEIFYLQKFYDHGQEDYRLLVVGDQVLAAMKRKAKSWKTNVSRGAIPEWWIPPGDLQELAIKAAKAVQGEIIGVDLMLTHQGPMIIEVNAVPGYLGLQSVCPFNISEKIVEFLVARGKK